MATTPELERLREQVRASLVPQVEEVAQAGNTPVKAIPQPVEDRVQEENKSLTALGNFNFGLTNLLGAPVDLINIPLKATGVVDEDATSFMSSEWIRNNLREFGANLPEEGSLPDGFINRAARIGGESVLPTMALRSMASPAAKVVAPQANKFKQALVSAYQGIKNKGGGEAVAVGTAAAGGEIADALFPDNYLANMFGELVGSLTPAAAVATAGRLPSAVRTAESTFRGAGAKARAGKRIQAQTGDIPEALGKLQEDSLLDLSAATRTEDAGILALQKAAMDEDPKVLQEVLDGFDQASTNARILLLKDGNPDDALVYLTELRRKAAATAQKKITELGLDVDPITASRTLRGSVDEAYKSARATESAVWGKLPFNEHVPQEGIANKLKGILSKRNVASDPDDIPSFLTEIIGKQTKDGFVVGSMKSDQSFNTMKVLRSRVQQARQVERAKDVPNRVKLGVLGEVEESIFEAMVDVSPEYQAAVDYSRQLNVSFTQGRVGKLLGFERSGGQTVTPDGSFSYITSGGEDKIRQGIQQVLSSSPEARPAMAENIKGLFNTSVMVDGALDVDKAQRFLSKQSVVLEEFPELRKGIEATIKEQRVVDVMLGKNISSNLSTRVKNKSIMSLYLDADGDNAMHSLLTSKNHEGAGKVMEKMVKQVNQDKSGKALSGLKSTFSEYLIRHSQSRDSARLSGNSFLKLLDKFEEPAKKLLSPEEFGRLKRIGVELRRVEKASEAKAAKKGVINDAPAKIISMIGGGQAAKLGGSLGGGNAGGSLRTANIASSEFNKQIGNLTNDKARNILVEAVTNPKVMEALLMDAIPSNIAKASKILQPVFSTQAVLGATEEPAEEKSLDDLRAALRAKTQEGQQ